jgi:hypothetical protein
MDLLHNYYQSLLIEEAERDIVCLLLNKNSFQVSVGLKKFSKIISSHVSERDLIRLSRDILPLLIMSNAFVFDNNEYLTPKEALEMIASVLYSEILYEEFIRKSGRNSFFIASFKSVKPDWCYFAYEFLLCKSHGESPKDLLALSIGLQQYDLNVIAQWTREERVEASTQLTRKRQVGVFQDGSYIGFANYKKINDVEDILQMMFEEINLLTRYFYKAEGMYFELYGNIPGIKALPAKLSLPPSPKIERRVTLLEKNLSILKLQELPSSKKELKASFFRLAVKTHPDKFEHIDKGTRTEIAIIDTFREIHSAFEFIEKELEKRNID